MPTSPSWDDTVEDSVPSWDDTFEVADPARAQRRAAIVAERDAESVRGDELAETADDLARQERNITAFAKPATTIINAPGRAMAALGGVSDTYEDVFKGGPLLSVSVPEDDHSAIAGVGRVGANLVNTMFDPDELVKMAAFGGGGVAKLLAATPMVKDLPDQIAQSIEKLRSEDTTAADKAEAVLAPIVSGVMLGGIAAHGQVRTPRSVEPPPLLPPEIQAADIGARNRMAPGTVRPQEIAVWDQTRPEAPSEMFQAGEVPFDRMRRFGGPLPPVEVLPQMGRIGEPVITDPSVGLFREPGVRVSDNPSGGRISFAAEAGTLNREAMPVPPELLKAVGDAEAIGLTKSAEAATQAALKARPLRTAAEIVSPERAAVTEPVNPVTEQPAVTEPAAEAGHTFDQVKTTEQAWEYGRTRTAPKDVAGLEQIKADMDAQLDAIKADPNLTPMQKLNARANLASGPLHFIKEAISAAKGETDRPAMTAYLQKAAVPAVPEGTVRLYRGEADGGNGAGVHWSTDPAYAATQGAKVSFVDLPAKDVAEAKARASATGNGTDGNHILTPDQTKAAQPADWVKPPEPVDLTGEVAKKPLPPGTKFTVQDAITVGDETAPRYVQVDFLEGGQNTRSSNPETLKAEGYDVPDTSSLKQGQHTLEDVAKTGKFTESAKVLADKLRDQFQTPDTGGQLGTFGAIPKVINAAVELAAKVIEKGGSVIDAINEAVDYIRKNHTGYFDEAGFRKHAETVVKPEPVKAEAAPASPASKKAPIKSVDLLEGERMRNLSNRATRAESVPEPVQNQIAESPESKYRQQKGDEVDAEVQAMSPGQRAALTPDSDVYVAGNLQTVSELFRDGKNKDGYALLQKLAKEGTHMGQLINQFKRLASSTPEMVASVLDAALKEAGKDGLTPEQTQRVTELAAKSKAADVDLNRATDAWKDKPTDENAAKAEAAQDAANDAAVDLQKFNARFTPKSWGGLLKGILQGNLISPMSHAANLVGNLSFMPGRIPSRAVRTSIDIIDNYLTGRPREFSADPVSGTAAAAKGLVRGAKKIPDILAKGSGDVIKGETRAGLHPVEAWKNQFAKAPDMPTTGGKLTVNDRIKLAVEGTLGAPAEGMLRLLGAGDAPFSGAARARATAEQLRLAKVPREQWDFAQKFPELFLNKEALSRIKAETADAVFQTESNALNAATRWIASLGRAADFAVATVAPYKLTPFNIVKEIIRFNPVVAFLRGTAAAIKGDSRTAKSAAGDMVAGAALVGAATWLYQQGLIAPSLDAKDEAQKARLASGKVIPPNHINISGLKRALSGGNPDFKPGDETRDFFRAGGLAGSAMYMVANVGRDVETSEKEDQMGMAMNILRQSTLEQARFGLNQSFLQGVEGLLTAIKDGNTDRYLKSWFSTVLSIPLPNTLGAVARATRENKPDTGDKKIGQALENVIKNRLGAFGGDDKFPLKRDFWGEPIPETPKGENPWLYHLLDVSKGQTVTDDPVSLELYRLWRETANSKALPSLITGSVKNRNLTYPLDPDQTSRLQELVGKERRAIVENLVSNPNFIERANDRKIEALNQAYRRGMTRGKLLFLREYPNLEPQMGRAGFDFSDE